MKTHAHTAHRATINSRRGIASFFAAHWSLCHFINLKSFFFLLQRRCISRLFARSSSVFVFITLWMEWNGMEFSVESVNLPQQAAHAFIWHWHSLHSHLIPFWLVSGQLHWSSEFGRRMTTNPELCISVFTLCRLSAVRCVNKALLSSHIIKTNTHRTVEVSGAEMRSCSRSVLNEQQWAH